MNMLRIQNISIVCQQCYEHSLTLPTLSLFLCWLFASWIAQLGFEKLFLSNYVNDAIEKKRSKTVFRSGKKNTNWIKYYFVSQEKTWWIMKTHILCEFNELLSYLFVAYSFCKVSKYFSTRKFLDINYFSSQMGILFANNNLAKCNFMYT